MLVLQVFSQLKVWLVSFWNCAPHPKGTCICGISNARKVTFPNQKNQNIRNFDDLFILDFCLWYCVYLSTGISKQRVKSECSIYQELCQIFRGYCCFSPRCMFLRNMKPSDTEIIRFSNDVIFILKGSLLQQLIIDKAHNFIHEVLGLEMIKQH